MTFSLKKEWIFISLLFILFLGLRLPAVHIPYHQDEYKWVQYAHPEIIPPGTVPHPPLTEFIYTRLGPVLGDNNFRLIPLGFSLLNFFLVFYLANLLFSKKTAFFVMSIFTVSFYSVLASVMVDVDGAVMPFFFLLLSIGYIKFKDSKWLDYKWIALMLVGAVGGFMIKVSAVLPIIAFGLDFAIENRVFSNWRKVLKYSFWVLGFAGFLVALLFVSKFIFPFFKLEYSFKYWEHFVDSTSFLGRGWFQTFIQFVKSVLYLSPWFILPVFFIDKELFVKNRPFFIFICSGLVFYLFLFDFSIGAIDRYLQFLVIPLSLISGSVYSKYFQDLNFNKKSWLPFLILGGAIFSIQFAHQFVPPLYPKTEWIHRIVSFKWNFLYPFSGGSGPIPFYVSFSVIGLVWLFSILFIVSSGIKNIQRGTILLGIVILGLVYNGVFIEEYIGGKINGSSSHLVKDLSEYIKNNNSIKYVTVYNDNGGWNIQAINKYRKRLYIDPKFDVNIKVATLNQYKEHYMVVDVPHISESTVYAKYLSSCSVVFEEKSGVISGKVYDCTKAPDLKI